VTGPSPAAPAQGPLAGIRVIEAGQLLAGPFCGQLLGDFGAEVIKLEPPGAGDPMRQWGREKPHGQSLWWPVVARNKKSVVLDLRTAAGQDAVRGLAAVSDVLIENFRPGTLERWGLGYDTLAGINPRIVLTRVTGFGQTGPYAPRAGFGSIGEAMGGLRYVLGEADRAPARAGISIGDSLAATYACIGTLAALQERERSGRGQVVDSAIYEAVLAMMESLVTEWQVAGYQRERTGAILPNIAPSNVYPTADGQTILIAANQDSVFRRLVTAMGEPELADDPRYVSHGARGLNQVELDEHIAAWSGGIEADPLLALLDAAGVPAGRIYRAEDMLRDPHMLERQSVVTVPDATFGELAMQNVAPRLSRTPGSVRWTGPALGQHTHEVLHELLGWSDEEIAALPGGA
jgi:formyl-CoA transferase